MSESSHPEFHMSQSRASAKDRHPAQPLVISDSANIEKNNAYSHAISRICHISFRICPRSSPVQYVSFVLVLHKLNQRKIIVKYVPVFQDYLG